MESTQKIEKHGTNDSKKMLVKNKKKTEEVGLRKIKIDSRYGTNCLGQDRSRTNRQQKGISSK